MGSPTIHTNNTTYWKSEYQARKCARTNAVYDTDWIYEVQPGSGRFSDHWKIAIFDEDGQFLGNL